MDASKKQEKGKAPKKQPVKEVEADAAAEAVNDVDKEYGVAVVNAFDLLSEDGPPKPAPKKKEEPKEDKKKKQDNKQKNAPRETNAELSTGTSETRPANVRGRGGAKGGRGQTVRRGGRGTAPVREGKRVLDRRSGTGRGREIRKNGHGGIGAAGTFTEEASIAQEQLQAEHDAEAAAKLADAEQTTPVEAKPQEPHVESVEEKARREEDEKEAKKKTYDQFLQEQKKKAVDADSQLNTREVEVDEKRFKPSKPLEEVDEVAEYTALKKEKTLKKGKGKAKKNVVSLDEFNAKAADKQPEGEAPAAAAPQREPRERQYREPREDRPPREERSGDDNRGGRGGRGGRGRGRGGDRGRGNFRGRGGQRGQGRGGRGGAAAPPLSDDNAFPKLG